MKIKYQFATETIEVEVTDDWGNLVIDLDRLEYNNDHKETRRHVSYDALDFDGDAMATEDPTLTTYTEQDELRQGQWYTDDHLPYSAGEHRRSCVLGL